MSARHPESAPGANATTAPLLQARGLRLSRGGKVVLQDLDLDLASGEILAAVGPNGTGKSTLLQALAGLLPPDEGSLRLDDLDLARASDRRAWRQRVTLVFQDPLLFDTTVAANLASGLRLRGVPRSERDAKAAHWAARLGLSHLRNRSARTLSGGEAQRTALARALILEPEILFLDEPFSALDAPTREALLQDLGAILRETGTAAVLVTHHLTEALRLADRLAVVMGGTLRQIGPIREVIHRPADAEVADFLGMEALVEGVVTASERGTFTLNHGLVGAGEQPVGRRLLVGIRPEHVTLDRTIHGELSARNQLPAIVTRILPQGPFFKVELDAGFFLSAFLTLDALEQLGLEQGSPCVAQVKATAVHVVREG